MKKVFKFLKYGLLSTIGILIVGFLVMYSKMSMASSSNFALLGAEAPSLTQNGSTYRDLNKNGKLDVYENRGASLEDRVSDLVSQMSLEEKAGSMFVNMIGTTPDGEPMEKPVISTNPIDLVMSFIIPSNSEMIARKKMNSFNILASLDANLMAKYSNTIQKMAERMRLGIPITIATDPRHGTENNPGAALFTPAFSQWPSSLGLAATRDTLLVREFADIARQEYKAVGLRLALHPMADLATEPRWGRANGTFGEDAQLSAMMTKAYVLGFQGDSLDQNGVACMTKHFSGGGPQEDGEDAHFPYGKNQVYPGNNFDYHIIPFIKGAFEANTAQIMPYYGIPMGQTSEDVAFGFNKEIITTLLRDSLNFKGVVCTDWNLISSSMMGEGRSWGVENLSEKERVKKVIDAGCDQFGGESLPELIIELVNDGAISEERIDISVKRIMLDKFRLGLFDDPYVNEKEALKIAGKKTFRDKGKIAQGKSMVLLKNDGLLPLKKGTKIYAEGMLTPEVINTNGVLVDDPRNADVILKKIQTPFEPRSDYFLERFFNQGRLYYSEEEKKEILDLINQKPAIVVVNLERATILTDIDKASGALFGEFGTSDEVLMDVLFGKVNPAGKLPFELPSSWEAVKNQKEDVPYDSENPLYRFGHGLSYE
jgi:beta-glucosidase